MMSPNQSPARRGREQWRRSRRASRVHACGEGSSASQSAATSLRDSMPYICTVENELQPGVVSQRALQSFTERPVPMTVPAGFEKKRQGVVAVLKW